MDEVCYCDIVKNINTKSKYFGQYAVSCDNAHNENGGAYFRYGDGRVVYTKLKSFRLVKRFREGEKIRNFTVIDVCYWGTLRVEYPNRLRNYLRGDALYDLVRDFTVATVV